jgi:hypothetical protein
LKERAVKKRTKLPDVGNLPNTKHMAGGEMVGVEASGYLDKKGNTDQSVAMLPLPPGMDIENQPTKDIRAMPMKEVTSLGYPGDGWD